MMTNSQSAGVDDFLVTKEYRRFMEFCKACRRHRYIGLCYGPPGVGKTVSARKYAQWDIVEALNEEPWIRKEEPAPGASCLAATQTRTAFYTPSVAATPKVIYQGVTHVRYKLGRVVECGLMTEQGIEDYRYANDVDRFTELLIVDEADRLKMVGLETLRDIYDQEGLGLILIGMPGIEKRLARYPQLYSRIGFVHEFRPLSASEMRFILEHKWQEMGLSLNFADFTDTEATATIIRITNGNFRLIQRLFTQIQRIMEINELRTVTKEVVETARQSLVIGTL